MTRRVLAATAVLLAFIGGSCSSERAGGTTAPSRATTPLTVAWINEGGADDDAWTAAQRTAADSVAAAQGRNIKVRFVEGVRPGREAQAAIDREVAGGADLVIGTSLALEPSLVTAARRHPEVKFEQVRGTSTLPNLSTFTGAYEQTAYLNGIAAASTSRTGRLGLVAQFPQPEMYRIIDGYTKGAQSVNPAATVDVAWTNSWWAPEAEAAAAEQLVDRGVDVLATTCTSLGTAEAARRRGVAWSGHDADSSQQYADVWLTANLTDWGAYYRQRVEDLAAGRWSSQSYYGTLRDGFVRLAPFGNRVPAAGVTSVEAARQQLVDGTLQVFAGPVTDNQGELRVPAGPSPDPDELVRIDWLVPGAQVVGS